MPEPPTVGEVERLALQRETWTTDALIHRIHRTDVSPERFNPGDGRGRFHPLVTQSAPARAIPTFYGGSSLIGALCETLFRLEPANHRGPFPVPKKRALQFAHATLRPTRSLNLLALKGDNLRALGLMRSQLLEPGPAHYDRTASWASILHAACPNADGLIWRSRQHDESECLVLFGDRVGEAELVVTERMSFEPPHGWQTLLAAATQAGFAITES
ncbi:RES domain-containing protein [Aromatoleum toluvorans]|uniref:RES domain-containing protein n=1 Tax=Aromatoleum toluvorans TaxID=92002 RepID=A0ABX1PUF4_9RHOO|nr:RES domain-containing protein [Aromatoleum toluvorans]